MAKTRVFVLISTILVVGFFGYLLSLYARGYRFDSTALDITPSGLLVMRSNPDGAQIFINGEFKNATNANISLPPDTYDVNVKKEGFYTWSKRLLIEKEIVTEADAFLFKTAPSLTAVTFTTSVNPQPSPDFTKIAYIVPATTDNLAEDKAGLWIMETINLPIGFTRDPKRITDGNLDTSSWVWSPNSREILLQTEKGDYLLDTSTYTPQNERVNIKGQTEVTFTEWEQEKKDLFEAQVRNLPEELKYVLENNTSQVSFSPDEEIILYTASASASLNDNLIPDVPGSSTQPQERELKSGNTYVYNTKEDTNFLVDENGSDLTITNEDGEKVTRRLNWFPSSRHLILAEKDKITIMDIDGTNRQIIYSGSYVSPNAFPIVSTDRILILTNLGANTSPPNLYSLGIR